VRTTWRPSPIGRGGGFKHRAVWVRIPGPLLPPRGRVDKASGYEPEDRGFESRRGVLSRRRADGVLVSLSRRRSRVRVPSSRLQPPVVQWTARQPPKLEVVGSSPTGRSGSDAEVAEAPGCEPGIRGFEFPQTPQGDSVNGKPAGSNPATEGSNPSSPAYCSVAKRQGGRLISGDREFESRQSDTPSKAEHDGPPKASVAGSSPAEGSNAQ
jgi:hypothetical protein